MATMNISLPETMKRFVEEQVEGGGYGTASEYIRELIRQAQKQAEEDKRLEALLVEGLDSGDPIEVTPEYWERKRQELLERQARRAKRA